ncbi:MAG TPA: GAF domain-containing sensor histidine kinase [Anaerolineaceae bacterium]|nr:GAF domain-containing sensor histidine kinase [Anaerolineaceae bacterium]
MTTQLTTEQEQIKRYQRLIDVIRDLASTLDLDELLQRIISLACELSDAQAASILLYDEATRQLYFQATTNIEEPLIRGINVPLEGSLAGWVVSNAQPVVVSDVHQDQRFFDNVEKTTQYSTHSLAGIPLVHKEKVLGVLEVLNKNSGDFTADDQEVLMALGAQAAVAIENARLFQQTDLVAELVHELRTPLSSLYTASYLLQRPEISDAQRARMAATIHKEIQRLNDMASSFLDFARLESGRMVFHPSSFELLPLLEECQEIMQNKAEENQIKIEIHCAPDLPTLEADRDKMKQVVLNLLSNAVKYNRPQGSVTVSADATPTQMRIAIQDTGIGISPDEVNKLGQKFYRVKGAERVASGTGLGLSICKRIVESHQGSINVQSQVDEGTTFTVTLPLRARK